MNPEKEVLAQKVNELQLLVDTTSSIATGTNDYTVAAGQLKGKGKELLQFENAGVDKALLEEASKSVNSLISNLVKASSYFNFIKKNVADAQAVLEALAAEAYKETPEA
ncbi:hypothetical protein [Pseudolactococcus insecticola]|uniref:Uncharacterized protein n=1 Tax=Pseudolactococcus insecticola TaxID=2709158 RepID=A0A6A0B6F4_9LACT|nr:hypothetical protein [Lactococcus insecticola]GFH40822.1 hypothetical protein Hs20B_12200 [Lactococcus insecticola]